MEDTALCDLLWQKMNRTALFSLGISIAIALCSGCAHISPVATPETLEIRRLFLADNPAQYLRQKAMTGHSWVGECNVADERYSTLVLKGSESCIVWLCIARSDEVDVRGFPLGTRAFYLVPQTVHRFERSPDIKDLNPGSWRQARTDPRARFRSLGVMIDEGVFVRGTKLSEVHRLLGTDVMFVAGVDPNETVGQVLIGKQGEFAVWLEIRFVGEADDISEMRLQSLWLTFLKSS